MQKMTSDADELLKTLRLLAIVALKSIPQSERIEVCAKAGFERAEIAALTAIPVQTIANNLVRLRKAKKI